MHHKTVILTILFIGKTVCEYLDIEKAQKAFISSHVIASELFDAKYWYLHTSELFYKMQSGHAQAIINHLSEYDGSGKRRWKDQSAVRSFYKNIRNEDVAAIKSTGVCKHLGLGLDLNPETFAAAHQKCASELVQLALVEQHVLESIPANLLQSHPSLAKELDSRIFEVNSKSLRIILDDAQICSAIEAVNVSTLGEKSIMRMVSPSCFAELKSVNKTDFANIRDFQSSILTKLKTSLTPATLNAITREQLKNLRSCKHLALEHISPDIASGMHSECLHSYLKHSGSRKSLSLGELWAKFDSAVLDYTLSHDSKIISNIHPRDYRHIQGNLLSAIFREPTACQYINRKAKLNITAFTKIEKHCFAKLSTSLQPQVLANITTPPSDLLALIDASMMSHWSFQKDSSTLRGFQVIRLVKAATGEIVSNLSKEVKDHACASIPNVATLIHERAFVEHATQSCIKALPFTLRAHECQKHPQLWIQQNLWGLVKGNVDEQDLIVPHLDSEHLKLLVASKGFCENVKWEFFRKLNAGAKKAIDKDCLPKLSFKKRLKSSDIAAMSPDVLDKVTAETFVGLAWDTIPEDRIPRLSSEILPEESSVFTTLDHRSFVKWTSSRLKAIDAKQWPHIPAEAFKGLTTTQVSAIPKETLKHWSYDQVRHLSKECILGLSTEQLQGLDNSALVALNDYTESLSNAQKSMIEKRIAETAFNWKMILLYGGLSFVLLVLIGAGIYAFLRFKKKNINPTIA
jgi:hypothetical protein